TMTPLNKAVKKAVIALFKKHTGVPFGAKSVSAKNPILQMRPKGDGTFDKDFISKLIVAKYGDKGKGKTQMGNFSTTFVNQRYDEWVNLLKAFGVTVTEVVLDERQTETQKEVKKIIAKLFRDKKVKIKIIVFDDGSISVRAPNADIPEDFIDLVNRVVSGFVPRRGKKRYSDVTPHAITLMFSNWMKVLRNLKLNTFDEGMGAELQALNAIRSREDVRSVNNTGEPGHVDITTTGNKTYFVPCEELEDLDGAEDFAEALATFPSHEYENDIAAVEGMVEAIYESMCLEVNAKGGAGDDDIGESTAIDMGSMTVYIKGDIPEGMEPMLGEVQPIAVDIAGIMGAEAAYLSFESWGRHANIGVKVGKLNICYNWEYPEQKDGKGIGKAKMTTTNVSFYSDAREESYSRQYEGMTKALRITDDVTSSYGTLMLESMLESGTPLNESTVVDEGDVMVAIKGDIPDGMDHMLKQLQAVAVGVVRLLGKKTTYMSCDQYGRHATIYAKCGQLRVNTNWEYPEQKNDKGIGTPKLQGTNVHFESDARLESYSRHYEGAVKAQRIVSDVSSAYGSLADKPNVKIGEAYAALTEVDNPASSGILVEDEATLSVSVGGFVLGAFKRLGEPLPRGKKKKKGNNLLAKEDEDAGTPTDVLESILNKWS
ncbi:hypothetical protein DRQ25_17345, partial [Candidatus Fermentibacteria bacterium]